MQTVALSLLVLLFMIGGGIRAQDDRQDAMRLWDQAVAAKGGRDRLHGIRSFAIHEKSVYDKRSLPDMAVGKVSQIVCVLPNRWWEFADYRPGRMGYSVTVADADTGLGWATHGGGPAQPFRQPNPDIRYRMRQLQYVYFLETSVVKPTPLRASRVQVGSRSVDRVETDVDGEIVVFYLDVDTHYPVRIETSRQVVLKPRPGVGERVSEMKYTYLLDRYHEVDGIHVPGGVTLGKATADARVEINPEYDPSVILKPPSPTMTVDSWRKSGARK